MKDFKKGELVRDAAGENVGVLVDYSLDDEAVAVVRFTNAKSVSYIRRDSLISVDDERAGL